MLEHFDRVSFFGDSLTDNGNYFEILYGYDPGGFEGPVYPGQTFALGAQGAMTNAFSHTDYLSQLTGTRTDNFAVVGATLAGDPVVDPANWDLPGTPTTIGLTSQVERYTATPAASAGPRSAAVFFIGANDIGLIVDQHYPEDTTNLDAFRTAARAELEVMAETLIASARDTHDAGAEGIFLGTLPSASFFPLFDDYDPDLVAAFDDLITGFNTALRLVAKGLNAEGMDLRIIDYNAICAAMTDDPSQFGVTALRQNYLYDGSVTGDDQVAFWNALHPAEAYHKTWAAFTAFTLDGGRTEALTISADTFNGTEDATLVSALAGDDMLRLGAGDDVGLGGRGADVVLTEDGNDIAVGGRGNDLLRGQFGNDILAGGEGDDTLTGGPGFDVLMDGLGSDLLRGGADDDVFIYVQASLIGGAGISDEFFYGGQGNDTLYLILDSDTASDFEGGGLTLADFGITTSSMDTIVVIDGDTEDGITQALGGQWWFDSADYWGLI